MKESVLSSVSETALITLRSRLIESQGKKPVIDDPVSKELFDVLLQSLSGDKHRKVLEKKLSRVLTRHIALRARKYDRLCRAFMEENPDGLIVNLGCGFDTRFWRLGGGDLKYLELDLPSLIQVKQELLAEKINYWMLEGSVLEEEWISKVKAIQSRQVLFIAEGLFMYLPKAEVIRTLQLMAGSFTESSLVMEVVAEKYTRGFRKKMVERKIKSGAGSTAGDSYQFGIRNPGEVEDYHPDIRLRGAWSYFEDPDISPAVLKYFRNFKSFSRTQYTIIADFS